MALSMEKRYHLYQPQPVGPVFRHWMGLSGFSRHGRGNVSLSKDSCSASIILVVTFSATISVILSEPWISMSPDSKIITFPLISSNIQTENPSQTGTVKKKDKAQLYIPTEKSLKPFMLLLLPAYVENFPHNLPCLIPANE